MTTVEDLISFLEQYRGWSLSFAQANPDYGLEFVPRLDMAKIVVRPANLRVQSFLVKADPLA